jgi:hypothetical protein
LKLGLASVVVLFIKLELYSQALQAWKKGPGLGNGAGEIDNGTNITRDKLELCLLYGVRDVSQRGIVAGGCRRGQRLTELANMLGIWANALEPKWLDFYFQLIQVFIKVWTTDGLQEVGLAGASTE